MADEKSEHSNNTSSSVTSPLQQKEDVGGSIHVFNYTRDIGELRDKCDDVMSLVQSSSLEKIDGSLLTPEVGDQVISGSTGSGLDQASNASAGPCLKRFATQPPPTIAPAVRSRIHPSFPTAATLLTYPTHTAPVPPQAQTAAFLPSLTQTVDFRPTLSPTYAPLTSPVQTARPGSDLAKETPLCISQGAAPSTIFPAPAQAAPRLAYPIQTGAFLPSLTRTVDFHHTLSPTLAPLPSPAQTARPASHMAKETARLHISEDLDGKLVLRRSMCGLCRKDIVIQPGVPPDVTELPCGHRFHTRCLQGITSADRSEKPPCIPCCMRERVPID